MLRPYNKNYRSESLLLALLLATNTIVITFNVTPEMVDEQAQQWLPPPPTILFLSKDSTIRSVVEQRNSLLPHIYKIFSGSRSKMRCSCFSTAK